MRIRTTLSDFLMKRKLFTGFIIAFLGVIGMVSAGIYLPEPIMAKWGLIIYLLGFGLITLGLLPYRKLSRLQSKPNEIRISDHQLEFWAKDQCRLIIPLNSVKNITFNEIEGKGEINLYLNQWEPIYNRDLTKFNVLTDKKNARIQLLYFSQRSYNELKNELNNSL
jgi:hypothetical protein